MIITKRDEYFNQITVKKNFEPNLNVNFPWKNYE